MSKEITKPSPLNGEAETLNQDSPDYVRSQGVATKKKEIITVKNQANGNTTKMELRRDAGTDEYLAEIMVSDATKDQKDSALVQYLMARGKDSASFLAELFRSKGYHTTETRAFKAQMRFDFEQMASIIAQLLKDCSKGIAKDLEEGPEKALQNLALRFESGANMFLQAIQNTTEKRMREKGFGIYINTEGQVYSIFDKEIESEVSKDKDIIKKQKASAGRTGSE